MRFSTAILSLAALVVVSAQNSSVVLAPCGTSCPTGPAPDVTVTRSNAPTSEGTPCPSLVVSGIGSNSTGGGSGTGSGSGMNGGMNGGSGMGMGGGSSGSGSGSGSTSGSGSSSGSSGGMGSSNGTGISPALFTGGACQQTVGSGAIAALVIALFAL